MERIKAADLYEYRFLSEVTVSPDGRTRPSSPGTPGQTARATTPTYGSSTMKAARSGA